MALLHELTPYNWTGILLVDAELSPGVLSLVIIMPDKAMADNFMERVLKIHSPQLSMVAHPETNRCTFSLKFNNNEELVHTSYMTKTNYPPLQILEEQPQILTTTGYWDFEHKKYAYNQQESIVLAIAKTEV